MDCLIITNEMLMDITGIVATALKEDGIFVDKEFVEHINDYLAWMETLPDYNK